MALQQCRECGAQISTEAEVCPHEQAAEIQDDAVAFIRHFINTEAYAVVLDYVKDGEITIDYREGGSPVVLFSAAEPLSEE